jgi:UDP-3-O-[3-hydroxymyristoyl] N-acetylglucosamine deacetylase
MTAHARQRTLKNVVRANGFGLHSGERVRMTLRPAPPDHGIVFVRSDLERPVRLPAQVQWAGSATLATALVDGCVSISTVEHLLSAFAGLGVDNALVEVAARELPIMDGSAGPFVFLLQSAGIEAQNARKRVLRILKPVRYCEGDAWAEVKPHPGCRFEYCLGPDRQRSGKSGKANKDGQGMEARTHGTAAIELSPTVFVREVSRARTPRLCGDGAGGLHEAANGAGLRTADEFLRHKILDAIGDLYLLGHRMIGAFSGFGSGHAINCALVRRLLADPQAFDIIDAPAVTIEPAADPIVQTA